MSLATTILVVLSVLWAARWVLFRKSRLRWMMVDSYTTGIHFLGTFILSLLLMAQNEVPDTTVRFAFGVCTGLMLIFNWLIQVEWDISGTAPPKLKKGPRRKIVLRADEYEIVRATLDDQDSLTASDPLP